MLGCRSDWETVVVDFDGGIRAFISRILCHLVLYCKIFALCGFRRSWSEDRKLGQSYEEVAYWEQSFERKNRKNAGWNTTPTPSPERLGSWHADQPTESSLWFFPLWYSFTKR